MSRTRRRRSRPAPARDSGVRDAKRERRLERQVQEAAARRRAARRRRVRTVTLGVLVIAAVGIGGFFVLRPDPEVPGVARPPNEGRGHVASPTFASATPTSGAHLAQAPRCTSYTQPLEPGLAVHALEHGAVVIWYDIAQADDVRPRLEDLADEWDSHVVLTPSGRLDAPIVATAWNRLAKYDEPGSDLRGFIDTYRRRGPERQPCEA